MNRVRKIWKSPESQGSGRHCAFNCKLVTVTYVTVIVKLLENPFVLKTILKTVGRGNAG